MTSDAKFTDIELQSLTHNNLRDIIISVYAALGPKVLKPLSWAWSYLYETSIRHNAIIEYTDIASVLNSNVHLAACLHMNAIYVSLC